jgi:uncharacterized protein
MPVPLERPAIPPEVVDRVYAEVRELYQQTPRQLPFHGWHHIEFVRAKALEFAARNRAADPSLVAVAALVHDLNYLVERNSLAVAGQRLRQRILRRAGVPASQARRVERVVQEAETCTRGAGISPEAQALSDADTLFKVLPITPVMLSHRYLAETGVDLTTLAKKITTEQLPLRDQGIYFYDRDAAARYGGWAEANLGLWEAIAEAVEEPAVQRLLDELR